MPVKIEFFSLLKMELNESEIEYEIEGAASIKEIIAKLDQDFGGKFSKRLLENNKIKGGTIILLNGHNIIHLAGLKTKVEAGDRLVMFPPAAGG